MLGGQGKMKRERRRGLRTGPECLHFPGGWGGVLGEGGGWSAGRRERPLERSIAGLGEGLRVGVRERRGLA